MKARFGEVEVDGTVDEVAALIQQLRGDMSPDGKAVDSASPDEPNKFISEEVAFRAFRRRPLSKQQELVVQTMIRNHPGWSTAAELQAATKYSPSQLAGLLGAFGKRVYATEGYKKGRWFLDQEWDYENGANKYRLPEAVLAAAKRAKL